MANHDERAKHPVCGCLFKAVRTGLTPLSSEFLYICDTCDRREFFAERAKERMVEGCEARRPKKPRLTFSEWWAQKVKELHE